MSALVFLAGAVAISLIGSLVWWLSQRPPTSLESSVDTFHQRLDALGRRAAASSREQDFGPEPRRDPGSGFRSMENPENPENPAAGDDEPVDDDEQAEGGREA